MVLSIRLSVKMHSFSYPNITGFIRTRKACIVPFKTILLTLSFAALDDIPTVEAISLSEGLESLTSNRIICKSISSSLFYCNVYLY